MVQVALGRVFQLCRYTLCHSNSVGAALTAMAIDVDIRSFGG